MALAGGTQNVGTPHEHVAREVLRVVRVVTRHVQLAGFQALYRVGDRVLAGGLGITHHVQRVGGELRRGRQPAHALGLGVVVDQRHLAHAAIGGGGKNLVHAQFFVAPLAGMRVEEAGAVHLAGRAVPVGGKCQRCPTGLRAQFFLAHVVTPATTALTDTATQHQHVDDAAVGHVHVVPVVQRGTNNHHGTAMGLVGVLRELARHLDHHLRLHAGVFLLPGRGVRHVIHVAGCHVAAAEATVDTVVGRHQVEYGSHQCGAAIGQSDVLYRHIAGQQFVMLAAEVREAHTHHVVAVVDQRQARLDLAAAIAVFLFQVPLAALAPAEAYRAIWRHQVAGQFVQYQGLPFRVVVFAQVGRKVGGTQEVVRHVAAAIFLQRHQHRHVGVLADVAGEVFGRIVEVEFLEDHVTHGHGQRSVGTLLRRQPDIAELGHFAKVGRHRHGLGALVAHFGIEVGVRGTGHRDVGTPHHQVVGVVPVGRFGHVGLLAPDLRAGRRQVTVPVVERQRHAADQAQVAATGSVGHHGHGRNRREAHHAVRTVVLDGESVGRSDDLVGFIPAGTHEAALTTLGFVLLGGFRVLADLFPGLDRAHGLARLAPQLHQAATHHRVLHALGGVHVPAVGSTTRAAARLVVGEIRAGARVVGLLGFPGNQAVLYIHLPATGAGAVHAVGRTHDLVVLPALAIPVFPLAVFFHHRTVAVGEGGFHLAQKIQSVEKVAHFASEWLPPGGPFRLAASHCGYLWSRW